MSLPSNLVTKSTNDSFWQQEVEMWGSRTHGCLRSWDRWYVILGEVELVEFTCSDWGMGYMGCEKWLEGIKSVAPNDFRQLTDVCGEGQELCNSVPTRSKYCCWQRISELRLVCIDWEVKLFILMRDCKTNVSKSPLDWLTNQWAG